MGQDFLPVESFERVQLQAAQYEMFHLFGAWNVFGEGDFLVGDDHGHLLRGVDFAEGPWELAEEGLINDHSEGPDVVFEADHTGGE